MNIFHLKPPMQSQLKVIKLPNNSTVSPKRQNSWKLLHRVPWWVHHIGFSNHIWQKHMPVASRFFGFPFFLAGLDTTKCKGDHENVSFGLWSIPAREKWTRKNEIGYALQQDLPNTPKEWLIHPWRFTWNIIMEAWKIMFLSKWVICRFHLNLPGHNEYEVDIWNVICITFLLHWQFHVYLFCILSKPEHTDFTKFIVFFWRLVFRDSKLKQKNPAAAHAKNNSAFSSFRFSAVYPSELASVWSWLKNLQRDMMKVAFAQNYTTEWQKTNMEPSWFTKMSKYLPSFRSNHIKSPCPEWLHTKIRQWIVVVHSSEKKNTSNLIFQEPQGEPYKLYSKWSCVMTPWCMAENKWVTGFITLLIGVIQ